MATQLEIAVKVIKAFQTKKKRGENNRYTQVGVSKIKTKCCAICLEERALELAHIFPVHMSSTTEGLKYLGSLEDNSITLCRNHHWLFDRGLLSEVELEILRKEKKDFVDGLLLELANKSYNPNPKAILTNTDKKRIKKFQVWFKWLCDGLYIKKNDTRE